MEVGEHRVRGEGREAFPARSNIFHGWKKIEDLCSRVGKKNKPGGGTIDSLFKRPLTLHTLP